MGPHKGGARARTKEAHGPAQRRRTGPHKGGARGTGGAHGADRPVVCLFDTKRASPTRDAQKRGAS